MKKISFYGSGIPENKLAYDPKDPDLKNDLAIFIFSKFKKEFLKKGIDFSTQDINSIQESDIVLYCDYPIDNPPSSKKENYLIIYESELIKPYNWSIKNHQYFKKIFTWNDEYVDNKKYFKYYWPAIIECNDNNVAYADKKFATLIIGNKSAFQHNELYSERLNVIRWFEKKHPQDFEFYGMGWERGSLRLFFYSLYKKSSFLKKYLGKLQTKKLIKSIFITKNFPSYRGSVISKFEILKNYKFAFCYENAKDITGYITEKIFDCFLAGCVPIYWGAPNITDFVPENTFIDKRKYKDNKSLYNFLKGIDEATYQIYLDNIKLFLESPKGKLFLVENHAKTVAREIF